MNETARGDMPPEEFRREADRVTRWIAEYLAEPERHPVLSRVAPGDVAAALPASPPSEGESFETILADFERIIVPGITHWNHPGFLAYFGITGGAPGILGELLTAALNVNAMLWRTSPAATELEIRATDWLRQMVDLPADFEGHIQDTASTSTLVAIGAAREAAGLEIRDRGMSGRELPRLRLYCSEEAHSSVEKAAITLGIGREGVRRIATDASFRMRADALEAAIAADLEAGDRPFCVVPTVGTTSTTSVDPVAEVVRIAREHGLWVHVDAAYGGSAAVVPELRPLLAGWEDADSIVLNPHKWLFVPIDCSVLLLRDPARVREAYSLVPEYLRTPEGETTTNLMDYGPALGRRFRALKLWMTLRYYGTVGIAARLRDHVSLAREFAGWVEAEPGWSLVAPVPFSAVCFRHEPPGLAPDTCDALNARILERVNASGDVFLSHTRLRGRYVIRLAVGNIRTTRTHTARAWELLRAAAADEA